MTVAARDRTRGPDRRGAWNRVVALYRGSLDQLGCQTDRQIVGGSQREANHDQNLNLKHDKTPASDRAAVRTHPPGSFIAEQL